MCCGKEKYVEVAPKAREKKREKSWAAEPQRKPGKKTAKAAEFVPSSPFFPKPCTNILRFSRELQGELFKPQNVQPACDPCRCPDPATNLQANYSISMAFKGVLVINTASRCDETKQLIPNGITTTGFLHFTIRRDNEGQALFGCHGGSLSFFQQNKLLLMASLNGTTGFETHEVRRPEDACRAVNHLEGYLKSNQDIDQVLLSYSLCCTYAGEIRKFNPSDPCILPSALKIRIEGILASPCCGPR